MAVNVPTHGRNFLSAQIAEADDRALVFFPAKAAMHWCWRRLSQFRLTIWGECAGLEEDRLNLLPTLVRLAQASLSQ